MGPVGKKCALEVDSVCLLMFSSPSTYGLPIPRHVTAYENTSLDQLVVPELEGVLVT